MKRNFTIDKYDFVIDNCDKSGDRKYIAWVDTKPGCAIVGTGRTISHCRRLCMMYATYGENYHERIGC